MPTQMSGPLNAAQTQYLNQLTQQSSESSKNLQYSHSTQQYGNAISQAYYTGPTYVNSNPTGTQQFNSSAQPYGGTSTYPNTSYGVVNNAYNTNETVTSTQHPPVRTKTQRARVPPPSKVYIIYFENIQF